MPAARNQPPTPEPPQALEPIASAAPPPAPRSASDSAGQQSDSGSAPMPQGDDAAPRALETPLDEPVGRLADVETEKKPEVAAPNEDEVEPDDRTVADMVLAGMTTQPAEVEAPQAAQPAPRPETTLSELVKEVADRILVGNSGPDGAREVRIILKDEVLGGSEIRISEHAGAIEVAFVAETKDAEQFLESHREDIAAALGERLDREVRVSVTDRNSGDTGGENPGQGGGDGARQEGGQRDSEGRSRNRRDVRDEQER